MFRIVFCFLFCNLSYGQTDSDIVIDSTITEKVLKNDNIGLLGQQFQNGKFYDARISDSWRLQTGLFNFNSDNFMIVELPLLVKHDFNKNFRAFFGTKLEMVIDNGFSTLQPLTKGSRNFGASAEFGFQYDATDNLMFELRYSLPIINQPTVYPSTPNLGNGGLLRLGTGFKF